MQHARKRLLQRMAPSWLLRPGRGMQSSVKALDAPMPFDFEHKAKDILAKQKRLKIGIVSFGTFGQFLARRLVQAGHDVRPPFASRMVVSPGNPCASIACHCSKAARKGMLHAVCSGGH